MRNAFAEEITTLGAADKRVVLLSGDIGNRLFDKFKDAAPERFHNCGIAEANMMSVAAGLALNGLKPVVYTITPFTTTRCYEQIRVDVCYHGAPVIIVGTGSGLSYAQLGPTHHSLEDIAILRALPGMTVFCPADSHELRAGLREAINLNGPVYIRLGKKGEPEVHSAVPALKLGRADTLQAGEDVCLLGVGNALKLALEAAALLKEKGLSVRVVSLHTIKPLDTALLAEVFARCKAVAVVEEHSVIGGASAAVAEWAAAQAHVKARLVTCALDDRFYHRAVSQAKLRIEGGLTRESVLNKVSDALAA
jgi:transketolase